MPIWLIQIIVGVVLSVASTLIKQATESQQQAQKQVAGFRGTVQTGGKVPLSFLVGTIGVPGKLEYRNAWGSSGGTPNAFLTDVISLGDVAIAGLTGIYVNSQAVTKASTGHTTQGYPVAEYNAGGADHLWWEFFDGTETTANTYLTGKFGSDADRPWATDMIGRGVPYVTMTALIEESLWTGFPTYMFECQGIPLLDPRLSTALGGSGSQVWGTPSTYAFSDNPAVIIYNILRGIADADGNHIWGGHARAAQLPYAVWSAAMEACDEAVALAAGGTEKRFRAGREISVSERPADVIAELLTGCNARLAMAGGIFYMLVGVPDAADDSFTDADVIATEGITLDPFPNLDSIVNGATATYLEPTQAWESKETAPYYRSDLEAEDDDRRQLTGLTLNTTFSGTQAQRILKATVEESRRFARHVVTLPPGYGQYRPLQVLSWTSAANGYDAKLFLITAKTEGPNGNVLFGLQEIDASDHDWTAATDESTLSFAPLTPIRPPAQPMAGWTATASTITDDGGTDRHPAITVTAAGSLQDVRAVRVQVRLASTSGVVFDGEIPYDKDVASPSWLLAGDWLLPATDYEVRGKFVPFSGRTTDWSDWISVTTQNIPAITNVLLASLSQEVLDLLDFGGQSARDMQAAIEGLALQQASQDFSNLSDVQTLGRKLVSVTGELQAQFNEQILAATGPGSAIVEDITTLMTALGGDSSGVNVRFSSSYTPAAGWDARFGLEAYSDLAGTFESVGIFGEVKNGEGRLVLAADQIVLAASDGTLISLFDTNGQIVNGTISGPSGASFWNLTTGAFRVST